MPRSMQKRTISDLRLADTFEVSIIKRTADAILLVDSSFLRLERYVVSCGKHLRITAFRSYN